MAEAFTVQMAAQKEWRWLVTISFFLEGIGGGLYLASMVAAFRWGMALSVVCVLLGVAFLVADLGKPARFWRALAQPRSSWISRGALLIGVFVVLALLGLLPGGGGAVRLAQTLAALAAFGVISYSGFLVAQSPAVPAWQSALLPILFALYALLGSIGLIFVLALVSAPLSPGLLLAALIGLLAALILLFAYVAVTSGGSRSGAEAARMLLTGELQPHFLGGVVLLGLVLPLALTLYSYSRVAVTRPVIGLDGVLILAGGLLFRYVVLRAGVYASLL